MMSAESPKASLLGRSARSATVAIAVALLTVSVHSAFALTAEVARGQALFQHRCAACHTIGQGDRVGPDLAGVGTRRDRAWLTRWISGPDRMLAAHDPVATQLFAKYRGMAMPNLGLAADEVSALVAYLTAAPERAATPTAVASAPLPPGDAAVGKQLFTGTRRLTNGGPPCMACHSIAGIGALGGGALGPDLTMAGTKYGASGLASVLASIPFPTMNPIFGTRRPLTADEQANLREFIRAASVTGRAPRAIGRLGALALAGTVALFGIAQLRWRRRLGGVRARMVEPARARMRQGAARPSRRR